MRHPRRFHRGIIVERRTQRHCWRGLLVLGAFCFSAGLVQNTVDLSRANRRVAAAIVAKETQLAELRQRHDDLLAVRDWLRTPGGILAQARPLGYGRTGERRVMFDEPR